MSCSGGTRSAACPQKMERNMYELRDLRLKAGPDFTIQHFARLLHMTVDELIELERTPLDDLTLRQVATYLAELALDIEVNATWLARNVLRQHLAPEGSLTIYGAWSIGKDAEVLEQGGRILQEALDKQEPPRDPSVEDAG